MQASDDPALLGPREWEAMARRWVDQNPPPLGAPTGSRCPRDDDERREWGQWTRALHAAGFACMGWPRQWGGSDAALDACFAVERVLAASGAPIPVSDIAVTLVGPALMNFGSPDQQQSHLPAILEGSTIWTQLFSEPGAGSDLAAVRTRARSSGDRWTISGQKTWNTYAHLAHWGFLLARTGSVEDRHRGLTAFLLPMNRSGVTIRPIREMTGTWDFNEVFLDDVVLENDHILGSPGQGWQICLRLLDEERRGAGRQVLALGAEIGRIGEVIAGLPPQRASILQMQLGELAAEAAAVTALVMSPGGDGDAERAKVSYSELNVAVHDLALDVIGIAGDAVPAGWRQRWIDSALYARAYTIAGGANEVLRDVIAKRYLALDQGTRRG